MQWIPKGSGIKYCGSEVGEFIFSFWFKTKPGSVCDPKIARHVFINQGNGILREAFFIGIIMPEGLESITVKFL